MYLIFLDDERKFEDVSWIDYAIFSGTLHARSFRSFKLAVGLSFDEEGEFEVSFDHDIQCFDENKNEITGYDCLKWLIDYCIDNDFDIPKCYFHTQNPVGKQNMECYYQNALKFYNSQQGD